LSPGSVLCGESWDMRGLHGSSHCHCQASPLAHLPWKSEKVPQNSRTPLNSKGLGKAGQNHLLGSLYVLSVPRDFVQICSVNAHKSSTMQALLSHSAVKRCHSVWLLKTTLWARLLRFKPRLFHQLTLWPWALDFQLYEPQLILYKMGRMAGLNFMGDGKDSMTH
jgi:hypothetical protein